MGNFFSNFGSTYRRETQINDTDGSGGQSAQPRKHFSWRSASVTRSCWLPWDGYIHAKGVVHITHPFKWHQVELQKNYRYRFLMLHLGGWVKFGTPWMSGEQWATQASKESLVLCDLQYICISSLVPWCLPDWQWNPNRLKAGTNKLDTKLPCNWITCWPASWPMVPPMPKRLLKVEQSNLRRTILSYITGWNGTKQHWNFLLKRLQYQNCLPF